MTQLLYVDQEVVDQLADNIEQNLERYRHGDFADMEVDGAWRNALSTTVDLGRLDELKREGGAESEIFNSLIVGHALESLSPTLARENRVWARLAHVECLEYARARWLASDDSDEMLAKDVRKHFFATTLTACRDDHAISRLWWNHYIAKTLMPENPARALKKILARADIRSNIIERPGIGARPVMGRSIIRVLEQDKDLLASEKMFRSFMKLLNLKGAGLAFEVWPEGKVDGFMQKCLDDVREARVAVT